VFVYLAVWYELDDDSVRSPGRVWCAVRFDLRGLELIWVVIQIAHVVGLYGVVSQFHLVVGVFGSVGDAGVLVCLVQVHRRGLLTLRRR